MLCRGFRQKFYSLHEFQAGRSGWIFALMMTVTLLLLLALERRALL